MNEESPKWMGQLSKLLRDLASALISLAVVLKTLLEIIREIGL